MVQHIEIVRGTTLPMELEVTDENGAAYTLGSGEKIIFGVKKKATDQDAIFIKEAAAGGTAGQYTITIEPEDTQDLAPGRYCYDVGLGAGDGYHNIIPPSGFTIRANVTERGDTA